MQLWDQAVCTWLHTAQALGPGLVSVSVDRALHPGQGLLGGTQVHTCSPGWAQAYTVLWGRGSHPSLLSSSCFSQLCLFTTPGKLQEGGMWAGAIVLSVSGQASR